MFRKPRKKGVCSCVTGNESDGMITASDRFGQHTSEDDANQLEN